ncbi:protein MANNAN SYNTHESIS-RELATED 2 [Phoenix dactylifera]|uniref:O-fucosyltransferase family protein n=1 Tax=Phoenix dactylifera TaxID=42345 RepID=A0A8B7CHM6_PHODC|nr:protein MANNAN SYNTHESIS-RELATED 2 [Phoenix dactylifera]
MAVDPRQVLAAFLTMSMFAMLGNMIKKDHFDNMELSFTMPSFPSESKVGIMRVEEMVGRQASTVKQGPWSERGQELKACWNKPAIKEEGQSKGFITFSLTGGPEYHVSQITDAVVIARYLGATLVLPDIRGSELGQKKNFEDLYDADRFMRSLDGVIKMAKEVPAEVATEKPTVVRVPNGVSEDFIMENVEPVFRTKSYLRLAIFFPSVSMKAGGKRNSDLVSTACLAMFGSLELKPEIYEVADRIVERLRTLSHKPDGQFIAVDLRVDILGKERCKESGGTGRKSCYNAQEVGDFLSKIGFDGDTTIYLTQTWWHESLDPLKEIFPKTYTKDDLMPADKKGEFLGLESSELERVVDFHICSRGDVFVPAISGLFYGNVAGKRIASGRTQILVPSQVPGSSAPASDFISAYVTKKNHLAYSCYC